jgi:hypothetical protein
MVGLGTSTGLMRETAHGAASKATAIRCAAKLPLQAPTRRHSHETVLLEVIAATAFLPWKESWDATGVDGGRGSARRSGVSMGK